MIAIKNGITCEGKSAAKEIEIKRLDDATRSRSVCCFERDCDEDSILVPNLNRLSIRLGAQIVRRFY